MSFLGILTIVLGIAAIAAPAITGLSVIMAVGVLVTVGGLLTMMWVFAAGSFGKGLLALSMGGLTALCGVSLLSSPLIASGVLTLILAGCLFLNGLAEFFGAFRLHPQAGRIWLLISGVASIVLAGMIWRQFPFSGLTAIGIVLGVKLLFAGGVMLTVGSKARAIGRL